MLGDGLRGRLYRALDPAAAPDGEVTPLNRLVIAAIVAAVAVTIAQTEPLVAERWGGMLAIAQAALGWLFVVEYLARLWVAIERPGCGHPLLGRLRYAATGPALIDLVATLPVFLGLLGSEPFLLRTARLLSILRVARLGRFIHAAEALAEAVASRRFELGATLAVAGLMMLLSSTLLYFAEGAVQPEAFGSIPRAMWWSVATLTTVGYGDVTPVTALGRVFAGLTAVVGIGLIAMPTGILAAALSNALEKEREIEAARRAARQRHGWRGPHPPPHAGGPGPHPPAGTDEDGGG